MKTILIIDDKQCGQIELYTTAFAAHAPEISLNTTESFDPADIVSLAKRIKPDLIWISLDIVADEAMTAIRALRQEAEFQNTPIAAFINDLAHDYSALDLNKLGVYRMWDRLDLPPGQVVDQTKFMLGL